MKNKTLVLSLMALLSLNAFSEQEQEQEPKDEQTKDLIGQQALQDLINWECSEENPFRRFSLNCELESTTNKPKQ